MSTRDSSWARVVLGLFMFGTTVLLAAEAVYFPGGTNRQGDQKATTPSGDADLTVRAANEDPKQATGEPVVFGNVADLMSGNVPTFPVIRVDYRDDEGTRLRAAGLLEGPMPMTRVEGAVAGGNCSFAIECDDGNRCTRDTCDFEPGQPAGSGTCVHTPAQNGDDGSSAAANCPGHLGLHCGGCNDGLFCNGEETCQGGSCVDGPDPCPGICSEDFDLCQSNACINGSDCSNAGIVGQELADVAALTCNGTETCNGGVCRAGTNPCGSGANCAEKRCSRSGSASQPHANNVPCISNADCAELSGSTCTVTGPVCQPGRCCTGSTEPVCRRRFKDQGRCTGGGANNGAPCRSNADCANNVCTKTGSDSSPNLTCDNAGGLFYGGDDGTINSGGGVLCGLDGNLVQGKCPKYGAGIAPSGVFSALLGPISESSILVPPFGAALQKLGDDYVLSDPGVCVGGSRAGLGCGVNGDCPGTNNCNLSGPSYVELDHVRFAGGSSVSGRVSIEFYDVSSNFVEDVDVETTAAFGIRPILLDPALHVPARGYVVFRTAQDFSPNTRFAIASTDAVDVGSNNANLLWVNGGPVASNFGTTGRLAFELEGTSNVTEAGACCNDINGVCTNNVLAWVCTQQGNHYQGPGSTCPANCGTGACCSAVGGCSITTQGACTNPFMFQGFGSDCDTSNGNWDTPQGNPLGEAHCCRQPVNSYRGRDNCEDVVPVVITAPPQGEVKVITVTGNNSNATSTVNDPDSCFPPSSDPNADPGWFEAFTLVDDCTYIYVDHCCTYPVRTASYSILYDNCPCGSARTTVANPYKFGEPPHASGAPYCDDDNPWNSFGMLGPGTYYYPISSSLAGQHGEYQLHIVAEACPKAACCLGEACEDNSGEGLTRFECDALGGVHLAPPNNAVGINPCIGTDGQPGSTCYTGSCCTGPGECVDVVLGQKLTENDCTNMQGTYVGFQRCEGSFCSSTPNESCNDNADCPNSDCVNNDVAEAQRSPCPICEIEGVTNCQSFENVVEFAISDRSVGTGGLLSADNFQPSGTTLNQVCVYGFYLNFDPNSPPEENDCSGDITADHFRIRVWDADVTGRVPNNMVGESLADNVVGGESNTVKGIITPSTVNTRFLTNVWAFQLKLDTPIGGLTAGDVYFLEISNDLSDSHDTCKWNWMQKTPVESSFSFSGTEQGYEATFESPTDNVWCVNMNLDPDEIGGDLGACCTCDGNCSLKTLLDCGINNGVWDVTKTTCAGVVCPVGAPPNDNCSSSQPVIGDGTHVINNRCATTDGFGPIPTESGDSHVDSDRWYRYIAQADCPLEVSLCRSGLRFDSVLAVYRNPGNPTVCPPCPLNASTTLAHLAGVGQDDSCTGVALGGSGVWTSQDQLGRNALPGECFLLRIGGAPGSRGTAILDVSCDAGSTPPPPPDPHSTANPTFVFFGSSDVPVLPADFFYPGSQPFFGSAQLRGDAFDSRDTLVQRPRALNHSLPTDTIPVEIVSLNLVSIQPIHVSGIQGPSQWNVQVELSATPQIAGSLNKTSNGPNGGTFNATLPVRALFTFTRLDDPQQVRVLDTGLQGMPAVQINLNNVPYVINLAPHLQGIISAPSNGNFVPGVNEQNPGDPSSQVVVVAQGNSSGGGVTHSVEPPPPPPPPPDPHRTANPTSVNFGSPDVPPIPAGFFYPGSQPFFGFVQFEGDAQDSRDTLVQRARALDHSQPNDSVPIEIVSLDLVSVAPISVNGSQGPSLWNAQVQLSATPQNPGVLNKTTNGPNGGTFDATFPVRPMFTFTRVSDPAQVRVLDSGVQVQINLNSVPYVVDLAPHLDGVIYAPSDGNFVPGVFEQTPGQPPTQIVVHATGTSQGGGVTHTIGPPVGPRLIPAGEDCWETTCGRTQYDFSATPIPAGFFNVEGNDNTLLFADDVLLEGATGGDTDTSVRRCNDVLFPDVLPVSIDVPIELVSLNLRSCTPIAVQDCCKPAELWNVEVMLSPNPPPPCSGSMTLTKTHDNGGTFTSQFPVQAKFRFTRINPPSVIREFDTGLLGFPPENLPSVEPFDWVHRLYDPNTAHACGINFVPGVEEFVGRNPTEEYPQCCTPPRCHGNFGGSDHCTRPANCSGCPGACCDLGDGSCSDVTAAQCTGIFKGIHSKCADGDGDGIADDFETGTCCGPRDACNTGTDPFNPDSDGDGVLDGAELAAGTDACNPCDPSTANPACPPGGTDCNNNGNLDVCDIAAGTSADCDTNNIPDECQADCDFDACADACEIICGTQVDNNDNGIPDDCESGVPAPMPDPTGVNKTRFISFSIPASPASAIRVRLVSLHHVVPPYTGGPSIPFTSFEGEIRWVGPPIQYVESSASGVPFYASRLQCDPHYQDWSTVGLLHVTSSAITPSSAYEVENVAASCMGSEASCAAVSAPLSIATTRWGDVRTPYNPPDPSVQPDISDVSALVDKFRNALGAPIKARALQAGAPGNTFGEITHNVLNVDFGFSHISACVDAFRGVPYPYTIQSCPLCCGEDGTCSVLSVASCIALDEAVTEQGTSCGAAACAAGKKCKYTVTAAGACTNGGTCPLAVGQTPKLAYKACDTAADCPAQAVLNMWCKDDGTSTCPITLGAPITCP